MVLLAPPKIQPQIDRAAMAIEENVGRWRYQSESGHESETQVSTANREGEGGSRGKKCHAQQVKHNTSHFSNDSKRH